MSSFLSNRNLNTTYTANGPVPSQSGTPVGITIPGALASGAAALMTAVFQVSADLSGTTTGLSFGNPQFGADGLAYSIFPLTVTTAVTAGARYDVTPVEATNTAPVTYTVTPNATGAYAIVPAIAASSGLVAAYFKKL